MSTNNNQLFLNDKNSFDQPKNKNFICQCFLVDKIDNFTSHWIFINKCKQNIYQITIKPSKSTIENPKIIYFLKFWQLFNDWWLSGQRPNVYSDGKNSTLTFETWAARVASVGNNACHVLIGSCFISCNQKWLT